MYAYLSRGDFVHDFPAGAIVELPAEARTLRTPLRQLTVVETKLGTTYTHIHTHTHNISVLSEREDA